MCENQLKLLYIMEFEDLPFIIWITENSLKRLILFNTFNPKVMIAGILYGWWIFKPNSPYRSI